MPCPNCSHTLAGIGGRYFHCERCGTLVHHASDTLTSVTTPRLVERCREFETTLHVDGSPQARLERWRILGVHESIFTPEARRLQ